jgi:hypothetical protein
MYRSLIDRFISQLYRNYKVSIMPIMLEKMDKDHENVEYIICFFLIIERS